MEQRTKHIFEELRDMMIDLKEHCIHEIEIRAKILNDENGDIQKLVQTAEHMISVRQLMKQQEQNAEYIRRFHNKLSELKAKFSKPVE